MSDQGLKQPTELAIFPLNLVLFPGATLPLKIFEQRYIDMTKACLRDELPFGVCLIRDGSEVGAPAEHETVGCSARIMHWDMPHTGIFLLACTGEQAFRLHDCRTASNGLISGGIEWLDREDDVIEPAHLETCRSALKTLAENTGEDIFGGPARYEDPEWVSYRLCELLPIDNRHKQALLEQRGSGQRLAEISRIIQPS